MGYGKGEMKNFAIWAFLDGIAQGLFIIIIWNSSGKTNLYAFLALICILPFFVVKTSKMNASSLVIFMLVSILFMMLFLFALPLLFGSIINTDEYSGAPGDGLALSMMALVFVLSIILGRLFVIIIKKLLKK